MSHRRVALSVLVIGLAAGPVFVTAPAHAAPEAGYEMPFPCGQQWSGTTRSSHSPSALSIDWNRPDDLGDPVVASAPGVVKTAQATTKGGYGRWVELTHAAGEGSLYAHLSSVSVVAGQVVDQGTLLGYVGDTGKVTGAHLHYEQKLAGKVVAPWLHGVKFVFGTSPVSQNCVDVPMAANMIGGPAAELVVFRRTAKATFQVRRPGLPNKVLKMGTSTDEPLLGDWDGDGRANVGIRRPARQQFRLRTKAGTTRIVFGEAADRGVSGDWDGDGRFEIGVRRAGTNTFLLRAADGTVTTVALGAVGDLAVTGDWDGDGITDVGVYDQATATYTLRIVDEEGVAWLASVPFGQAGDLPVTGDWDGNLRTDVGVWNPQTARFDQRRATSPMARSKKVTQIRFGRPR